MALIGLMLGACATYYPAARDSGVYYEVPSHRTTRVAYVDPLIYPYWSLDHFYYSRHYHPYSVVVNRYDPWYYPYPGWYYGYRPGPRFAGHHGRFHYPWSRYGNHYAGYRPWYSGAYLSFGYHRHERSSGRHRVREINARLHELETRRSLAVRSQRPERQLLPRAAPWLPATGRGSGVRRGVRTTIPGDGGDSNAGDRASLRRGLIQRLRAADRNTGLPERSERYRDRAPSAPNPTREIEPRRSSNGPVPRSQPQRQPTREPARPTRSKSRTGRGESSRRKRR